MQHRRNRALELFLASKLGNNNDNNGPFQPQHGGYNYVFGDYNQVNYQKLRPSLGREGLLAIAAACNLCGNSNGGCGCNGSNSNNYGSYGNNNYLGYGNGTCNGNGNYNVNSYGSTSNGGCGCGCDVTDYSDNCSDCTNALSFDFGDGLPNNLNGVKFAEAKIIAGKLGFHQIPYLRNIQINQGNQKGYYVSYGLKDVAQNGIIHLEEAVSSTGGLSLITRKGTINVYRPMRAEFIVGVRLECAKEGTVIGLVATDSNGCQRILTCLRLNCKCEAIEHIQAFLTRGTELSLVNLSKWTVRFQSGTDLYNSNAFLAVTQLSD